LKGTVRRDLNTRTTMSYSSHWKLLLLLLLLTFVWRKFEKCPKSSPAFLYWTGKVWKTVPRSWDIVNFHSAKLRDVLNIVSAAFQPSMVAF